MSNSTQNRSPGEAAVDEISDNDIELQSGQSLQSKYGVSAVYENEDPPVSRAQRVSRSLFHKHELHRVLERPHIAGKPLLSIL